MPSGVQGAKAGAPTPTTQHPPRGADAWSPHQPQPMGDCSRAQTPFQRADTKQKGGNKEQQHTQGRIVDSSGHDNTHVDTRVNSGTERAGEGATLHMPLNPIIPQAWRPAAHIPPARRPGHEHQRVSRPPHSLHGGRVPGGGVPARRTQPQVTTTQQNSGPSRGRRSRHGGDRSGDGSASGGGCGGDGGGGDGGGGDGGGGGGGGGGVGDSNTHGGRWDGLGGGCWLRLGTARLGGRSS